MEIMEMKSSHIPAVACLEKLCFSLPWSAASLSAELENPLSLWLVAEEADEVIGYIGSQTAGGESDMMNLAVVPDWRRHGIAGCLVSELERHLSQMGSTSIALEVRASNEPALKLYRNMGYSEVGRRPGYYLRPREDALIFRKEL